MKNKCCYHLFSSSFFIEQKMKIQNRYSKSFYSDRLSIVIENKDRLSRFGFDLFEKFCSYFGTKIIVANDISEKSYEEELTEDLISIIHYFSMKSYSHRRKLNKIKKGLENADAEDTDRD